MEGQRIGSYRVVRKIGQGGMGAVYEALHEQLGRRAAIKLLRKELSQDPQIVLRFFNEGKAASRIEHSGIVQIFEYGHLPDQTAYIIMEFLRGEALSARLRSLGGKLPLGDMLRISRQIASALAATHAKGIIHRDLKPDNVMLVPDSEMPGGERVKILDFGVAKVPDSAPGTPAMPGGDDYRTATGVVLGTASYMAPEQCKGAGSVNDKADVYSLGIVMYRMLIGHLPFRAEGQGEVMAMHIFSKARPLRDLDPNIPEPMAQLVERMMDKDPEQRPSMVLVAGELERLTAKLVPGGQPVVVLTSPTGPASSGQHPTAPTLSVGLGPSPVASGAVAAISSDRSEPAVTEPDPQKPGGGGHGLLYFFLFLVALGGAGFYGYRAGLLQPLLARLHPPPPPPPVELVYWSVNSIPSDAQVVRKSDGVVLGKTGWEYSQPKRPGKLTILLRKPGYKDLEIELDESQSQTPPVASLSPIQIEAADLGAEAADLAPATTQVTPPTNPPTIPPDSTQATNPGQKLPKKLPLKLPKKDPEKGSNSGTLTDDDISTDLDKK